MQHIKFSRSQTSKRPGEAKQKNAANQQKMACSGAFGTPGWVRTSGLSLRRRPLYPTELRGLIQKIFNFRVQPDSNELPLRRRTLYPGEVRGLIQQIFNFQASQDSNELPLRRGALYPIELLAHMKLWESERLPAGSPAYRVFCGAKPRCRGNLFPPRKSKDGYPNRLAGLGTKSADTELL